MAGDWIKMRGGLLSNPKVIRMSRFLSQNEHFREWFSRGTRTSCKESVYELCDVTVVTRVTVGTLLSVWSAANEVASEDGFIANISLFEVDEMAGVPGFGDAMELVGWCQETDEGVIFPNFAEHNIVGKSRLNGAKTGAQRTKEWRERKKPSQNVTRDSHSDVTVTRHGDDREEKRREENKDSKTEECNEPTKSASLPPAPLQPAIPTVMVFPCSGKGAKEWALTKQQIDDWAKSFPAVDVLAECRAAWAWIDANPTRKKTATGMKSFLVRWMGKAQNNGPAKTAPQQFKSSAEREREYSAKMAQNIFDRIPPEKLAEIAREEAEEKARQEARKLPTYRQTTQALSAAKPRKDPPPGFQYPDNWDTMQNYEQDMWLIDNGFSPVQRVKEYA